MRRITHDGPDERSRRRQSCRDWDAAGVCDLADCPAAKPAECRACHVSQPLTSAGTLPPGWLTIVVAADPGSTRPQRTIGPYCCAACAWAGLRRAVRLRRVADRNTDLLVTSPRTGARR
jgi:hypothetical protein